jgi:hypothetical protein
MPYRANHPGSDPRSRRRRSGRPCPPPPALDNASGRSRQPDGQHRQGWHPDWKSASRLAALFAIGAGLAAAHGAQDLPSGHPRVPETVAETSERLRVIAVAPDNGTTNVPREAVVQIHVSTRFDPASVSADTVRLLDDQGRLVEALVGGDLGGVISLTVLRPLPPETLFTVDVTAGLRSLVGVPAEPFRSTFSTGNHLRPGVVADPDAPAEAFRFRKHRIDQRDGVAGVLWVPGVGLVACTWDGSVLAYPLQGDRQSRSEDSEPPDTEDNAAPAVGGRLPVGTAKVLWQREDLRLLGLGLDRDGRSIWVTGDYHPRQSVAPNTWSGTLWRLVPVSTGARGWQGDWRVETWITGFPTGDHPLTSPVIGPDGRLYLSQGGLTMLGAPKVDQAEQPLSAAVLVVDLDDPALAPEHRPLDVRSPPAGSYDPESGPVRLYATGIRQAYRLCWHSNGQLYAGINQNDTSDRIPVFEGVTSFSVRPPEPLIRILPGRYYGHPNPSRNQWVLMGGNPAGQGKPWEIPQYPVGTRPEPGWDPSLLIYNLEDIHGPSANGCVEYPGGGPLGGRLLLAFYTATRGIHSFALSPDGATVTDHRPLEDEQGNSLRLASPLDLAVDSASGRLFVADFTAHERGDTGRDGGVWMLEPVAGFQAAPTP